MPTWLLGVTLGVAARMIVLGHYRWNELVFLLVALVFIGLFARPIAWLVRERRPKVP